MTYGQETGMKTAYAGNQAHEAFGHPSNHKAVNLLSRMN